jgi:hypothetical protein
LTIHTGDLPKGNIYKLLIIIYLNLIQTINIAGTDSNVILKFFGSKSSSSDIFIEKIENRFDRASADDLHVISSHSKIIFHNLN